MTAKKDDKPKRRKQVPIPIVGVRGSETMVSAPKVIVVGGATVLALSPSGPGRGSPVDDLSGGVGTAVESAKHALRNSWESGNAKKALIALGGMALFGKAIDRRFPGFPIKFGK